MLYAPLLLYLVHLIFVALHLCTSTFFAQCTVHLLLHLLCIFDARTTVGAKKVLVQRYKGAQQVHCAYGAHPLRFFLMGKKQPLWFNKNGNSNTSLFLKFLC